MLNELLINEIKNLRDWFHEDNCDTFIEVATKLKEYNISDDEIYKILSDVSWAISDEYGD